MTNQSSLFFTGPALSSNYDEWETPQDLFDELNAEFGFTIDAAADPNNTKCDRYYTKEQDGLMQDWTGEIVFVNPPYGRSLKTWVEKAYVSALGGATVVMLIPARTDTSYWHEWIFDKAEVRFLRGRLSFGGGKSDDRAPFPSAVVVWGSESSSSSAEGS